MVHQRMKDGHQKLRCHLEWEAPQFGTMLNTEPFLQTGQPRYQPPVTWDTLDRLGWVHVAADWVLLLDQHHHLLTVT